MVDILYEGLYLIQRREKEQKKTRDRTEKNNTEKTGTEERKKRAAASLLPFLLHAPPRNKTRTKSHPTKNRKKKAQQTTHRDFTWFWHHSHRCLTYHTVQYLSSNQIFGFWLSLPRATHATTLSAPTETYTETQAAQNRMYHQEYYTVFGFGRDNPQQTINKQSTQ